MNDEEKPAQVDEDVVEVDLIADAGLLAGLVEKTAADPGAPFAPEILASLADLRRTDRAAFETLRAGLKRTGCRVTALDEALAEEIGVAPGARTQTQADILLRLSQAADLFHASDGTGYADLDINGHRETWPVRSKGFTRWLARAFFDETNGAPSSEALQSALNVIEAKAHFDADRARRSCSRRQPGRQALPRSLRFGVERSRDRRRRVANRRRAAGAVPSRVGRARIAGAGARRVD